MEWSQIYSTFNPVAFEFFGFKIHWYALAYITALLSALYIAYHFVIQEKKALNTLANVRDLRFSLDKELLMSYFFWIEIGVILGARIGYILIYIIPYEEGSLVYYLSAPWQMFNPFMNGEFVGIRGMSFHGALVGALLSSILFVRFHRKRGVHFWKIMDLVGLSVPVGYVFGRIGNFLNQELVGRETDVSWGIYVNGVLRHPSQLYEAVLEGPLVFIIVYAFYRYRLKQNIPFCGQIGSLYMIAYSLARFCAEFFREPDSHIGFLFVQFSMGQILCLAMAIPAVILLIAQMKNPRFFCPHTASS
ncbi:prolipoprotein diacylglyceryl transferase [Helicobacter monodelphidis]|uniref:prolipoprotein diacylglyceryl transferase n=1 Tax=Helicobacter sp. 15-1451 TaxID=2004995 RepID=UPI000DCF2F22|nr:prolipoprotein diacylglyceryl transferase [Helicobacter sp. 15-1451]RAX57238.1 prolipoprotein diacylglyceryl transferase [Helicobacter sp. 15-1451]